MSNFYCVPLGEAARDIFCEELKHLPKGVLVVPNGKLKEQVLRQHGIKSLGLDEMAAKLLNRNGYMEYKEINRRTQEIIVQSIIKRLLNQGRLVHFAKLAEKRGFVSSVTSLIGQLSRSGATAEELDFAMEAWDRQDSLGMKDREITFLYDEYCAELDKHKWYDLEGKFKLALEVLERENPVIPWSHVYLSDFYTLDVLKHSFVHALGQHCQLKIGITYEKNRDSIFRAVDAAYATFVGYLGVDQRLECGQAASAMSEHLRKNLYNDVPIQSRPQTEQVHTFSFRSRDEEMRWVLTQVKRLLQGKSTLFGAERARTAADDIVLVVRDFANYTGLRALADEYGLPISLPKTAELGSEPITSFVQMLLQSVENSYHGAQAYFKLLESAIGRLIFTIDGEKITKLQQEKYFNSPAEIRDRIKFEQEQGNYPEDAKLELINEFITSVPFKAELEKYVEAILELLKGLQLDQYFGRMYKDSVKNKCSCCITIEQLQEMLLAKKKLVEALTALAGDYATCEKRGLVCSLQEWRQLFNEAVKGVQITLADGRQDGVLVTEAINLQGLKRDYVFMLGMREGEFPSGKTESWLYDDNERELLGKTYKRRDNKVYSDQERGELMSLGIEMPNTAAAYAEDAYFFASAVAAAEQGLVLTWFEDDENGASRYVEEVQRLFANVRTEKVLTKEPASANELYCLGHSCDQQWLKEQVGEAILDSAEVDILRREYSAAYNKEKQLAKEQELLESGLLSTDAPLTNITAADEAALKQNGRYNGVLAAELEGVIRKRVGNSFSPSALEAYAACPFMYLGKRVWKQDEFGDREDRLNKLDEGNIYHAVMDRFIREYLHTRLTELTSEEQMALPQRLTELFIEVCQENINKGILVDNEAWQAEKPRMLRNLQKWLRFELEDQALMPVMTPAATEWEFEVALDELKYKGKKVYLKGKIDRIDASADIALVTDYKRTKNSAPAVSKLSEGLDMQMPIYMLSVEVSFDGGRKILGETYYSIVDAKRVSTALFASSGNANLKNSNKFNMEWEDFKKQSLDYLKEYISGIYSGDFAVLKQRQCSDYCPLMDICRYKEIQQLGKEGEE